MYTTFSPLQPSMVRIGSLLFKGVSVMPLLVTMSEDTELPLAYSHLDASVQSKSTML